MFYEKSREEFRPEDFRDPGNEYRGCPFWAWNTGLDKDTLLKEIDELEEMGMGGAHIHSRVGLDTPYMGEEFMSYVKACNEKMVSRDMRCCLYDEDRWPSGTAGGMVTKDHRYRSRFLVVEPEDMTCDSEQAFLSAAGAVRSDERTLIAEYEIEQSVTGRLTGYTVTMPGAAEGKYIEFSADDTEEGRQKSQWKAYLEVSGDTPWFNNEAYVNTLDKAAMDRFVELTHERYYSELKDSFGKSIRSVFTDEPQMCLKEILTEPFEKRPVIMPFTDDLDDTFRKKYGFSLIERIPELVWETESISKARLFYHRHLVERFSEAFGDNVGEWCNRHGIGLTGHMMNEWTLFSSTSAVGEVMRPMKHFAIPGMDMLCDRRELTTAKQVQSISRQMGREGVMSEIYGVTGWHFDFRRHKLAGDWQAALGVTFRVPHLTWVSMAGEGKRDYPASIGHQSPWYREYKYIEDHFARVNMIMTRGKSEVKIGVIHPIESYWALFGNRLQTGDLRAGMEDRYEELVSWLLYGLLDFDFVSEAVLAEEDAEQTGEGFITGCMQYACVIVPELITMRRSTAERLLSFASAGGNVIFLGDMPEYIDGDRDGIIEELRQISTTVGYDRSKILTLLEPYRDIDIAERSADRMESKVELRAQGIRPDNIFYQMRREEDKRWLFLCHVNPPETDNITRTDELTIKIRGKYKANLMDTLTGEIKEVPAEISRGQTLIKAYVSAHSSLLYSLEEIKDIPEEEGKDSTGQIFEYREPENAEVLPEPVRYDTDEPNVLLLDTAEYAFDKESWQSEEELLRIDNSFRERLGYPLRTEALAQPWIDQETERAEHSLSLRFSVYSEVKVTGTYLALEEADQALIKLNGTDISGTAKGCFVDDCIKTVPLPPLDTGNNLIEVSIPFGRKTNIEWMYLIGDFGVRIEGRHKTVISKPDKIYYGDYTVQGLPFYAGNIVYSSKIETGEGRLILEASDYSGALLKAKIDDGEWHHLTFAPYRADLGYVTKGQHRISLKLYGNRANAFGPVHNTDDSETWYGPDIWRTKGKKFSYEYRLRKMGILSSPYYYVI